jgi:TolB protein
MPLSRPRAPVTALVALVLSAAFAPLSAQDTTYKEGVRIGLTYAPGTKPGVVVLPIASESGDSIRAILQRDFENGDRINVIALDATPGTSPADSASRLNYPLYARLGAAAVLQVTPTPAGLHVAVHNAVKGQVERVREFPITAGALTPEWRLAVHAAADEVELWITGVRGISASRVLYVSGGRVWQIDSDGANPTALSNAVTAMAPVWHPKASHIAYSALAGSAWQIVLREAGGATRALGTTPGGLNTTPAFSPDGTTLIYAHGAEAGTHLYSTNAFGSEPARRITVGGGDNVSPTFSPDGRRIAFTSSRSGHPEVYTSDADGTNAELLTPYSFGDQSYRSNPDWSPDGRLIAFQSQLGGRFQIMTIGLRDRALKQHTSEGVNEDPSWAPDSRHLVFTSDRGGMRQIWVLDTESGNRRQLTRAASTARLAAWSPLLRSR